MTCTRIPQNLFLADRWHALWCAECRVARRADTIMLLGVECMKAQPFPETGLANTLAAMGILSSPTQRWRRLWIFQRRFAWSLGLFSLFATTAGAGWIAYINIDSNLPIPASAVPSPNGYDALFAAANHIVDYRKIEPALLSTATPALGVTAAGGAPSSNRREPMNGAIQAAGRLGNAMSAGADVNMHIYSLAEKKALVQENQAVLTSARQGIAAPYWAPFQGTFSSASPRYDKFKLLAELLALEAQTKAQEEDWQGAVNSGLDAMQLGAQIPHGAPIIGKLVGIHCEEIGRKAVWNTLNHLTVAQTRDAIVRLQAIRALYVPYADALEQDKWMMISGLQNDFRKPGYPFLLLLEGSKDTGLNARNTLLALRMLTVSKRQIVQNYANFMDRKIEQARKPGASRPAFIAPPDDPVNEIIDSTFEQAQVRDAIGADVEDSFLVTAMALRAYHLEHGQYPEALPQITPRYLTQIPRDPFSEQGGQPLQYRRTEKGYLLYSVGPDGRDDGGVSIPYPVRPGNVQDHPEYEDITWDSRGDIVAERAGK